MVSIVPGGAQGAEDSLSLDSAYAGGIGFLDEVAIDYGYRVHAPQPGVTDMAAEVPALRQILDSATAAGYAFLTDQDNAANDGVDWRDSSWDSGSGASPGSSLRHALAVRNVALRGTSE